MKESRQRLGAEACIGFHRAASAMLPVHDREKTIEMLASLWCETTNAGQVLVVTGPFRQQCWVGYHANDRGQSVRLEISAEAEDVDFATVFNQYRQVSPVFETDATNTDATNTDVTNTDVINTDVIKTVPFCDGDRQRGAALLIPPKNGALLEHLLPELSDWSMAVVAQIDLLESMIGSSDQAAALEFAKLESLAEFAEGAGHEINNPLATISGRVQLLLRDETDPERRRALATIGGQAYRVRDMIGDLMLFGRPPDPEPCAVNLSELLRSVLAEMAEKIEQQGCTVNLEVSEDVAIWADRDQLAIVVGCLLKNSLEAARNEESIHIRAQPIEESGRNFVRISVSDTGVGLSDNDRLHLFDPFYSGRQAGRGLGFGLSKCWRIVTNHGGRISIASAPGEETKFEIDWPAESGAIPPQSV